MQEKELQEMTIKRFDWLFNQNRAYYERQTKQDEQIIKIIDSLELGEGKTVLDLGTGTGYIASMIAKAYPEVSVIGSDIVETVLEKNRLEAKKKGLTNLSYVRSEGTILPLEDESVDIIVTRFALHHFIDITTSFKEFARILKNGGQLFICDPTPNPVDKEKSVDRFMKLAGDGHVTYYTEQEFVKLAGDAGLKKMFQYMTSVTFPSASRTEGYLKMEQEISEDLKVAYHYEMRPNENNQPEIWTTQDVLNISFRK